MAYVVDDDDDDVGELYVSAAPAIRSEAAKHLILSVYKNILHFFNAKSPCTIQIKCKLNDELLVSSQLFCYCCCCCAIDLIMVFIR